MREGLEEIWVYYRSAGFLIALALLAVAASPVLAQSARPGPPRGACFEVIRAHTKSYRGAILLNRCTGDSWLLARTYADDRVAYRWQPIAMDKTEVAYQPPP